MVKGVQQIAAVLVILAMMLSGCAQNNGQLKSGFSNIQFISSEDQSILSKLESDKKVYIEGLESSTGKLKSDKVGDLVQSQFYSNILDLGGTTIEIGNEANILTIKLEATEFNGVSITADDVINSITDEVNDESSPYRVLNKYIRRDTSGNIQNIIKNSSKSVTIKFHDEPVDTRFLEIPITYLAGNKIGSEDFLKEFLASEEDADLKITDTPDKDQRALAYIAKTDICYGVAKSELGQRALEDLEEIKGAAKRLDFSDSSIGFNLSFEDLAISLSEQQLVKNSLSSKCEIYTDKGITFSDLNTANPSKEIVVGITADALWLKNPVGEMLESAGYKTEYIGVSDVYSNDKTGGNFDLIIDYSWIYNGAFPSVQILELDNIFKEINRFGKCRIDEIGKDAIENQPNSSKETDNTNGFLDIQPLFTTAWYLYDIRGGK